jgi:hypothetical protein
MGQIENAEGNSRSGNSVGLVESRRSELRQRSFEVRCHIGYSGRAGLLCIYAACADGNGGAVSSAGGHRNYQPLEPRLSTWRRKELEGQYRLTSAIQSDMLKYAFEVCRVYNELRL